MYMVIFLAFPPLKLHLKRNKLILECHFVIEHSQREMHKFLFYVPSYSFSYYHKTTLLLGESFVLL